MGIVLTPSDRRWGMNSCSLMHVAWASVLISESNPVEEETLRNELSQGKRFTMVKHTIPYFGNFFPHFTNFCYRVECMILDFSVENYRSIDQEAIFSFVKPGLKTNVPTAPQTWSDVTSKVAAVFGPNAAGKTTLLRGFADLSAAVLSPGRRLYSPNKLTNDGESKAVSYCVNFTHKDTRYEYQVRAEAWGISWEALYSYPTGSKRTIFERTQTEEQELPDIKAGSTLKGPTQQVRKITRINHLFLAVAHKFSHTMLSEISDGVRLGRASDIIMHSENVLRSNLAWITHQLSEDPKQWAKVGNAIARVADLGIAEVSVEEREISPEFLEKLKVFKKGEDGEDEEVEIPEELLQQIRRSLTFTHYASDGKRVGLTLEAQSHGTRAWFALAGKAIAALRTGKILVVDELDSSLHPALSETIVDLFKDESLNKKGAQLFFTTHDVSLMGNSPTRLLEFHEIWLVEKNDEGSSEVCSLADFDLRKGNNAEKKYLAGAFGAIPDPALIELKSCLED